MTIDFNNHPVLLEAIYIIQTLEEAGHSAYFVGGAVRDVLLARPIHDVDIATSAKPEETSKLFPKVFATGLQHGTITVVHKGINYEVTTYRVESDYIDFRRPNQVSFMTELKLDLSRRDFTMNAMAINRFGELVDYFDGQAALRTNTLVAVGDASARFQEDALRMLRAIRFATNYELICEDKLWQALTVHKSLLAHIAMERVSQELSRLISKSFKVDSLKLVYESELLNFTKQKIELQAALSILFNTSSQDGSTLISLHSNFQQEIWFWAFVYFKADFTDDQIRNDLNALVFPKKTTIAIRMHVRWLKVLNSYNQALEDDGSISPFINAQYSIYERYFCLFDEVQLTVEALDSPVGLSRLLQLYWLEQLQLDDAAKVITLAPFLELCGLGSIVHKLKTIEVNSVIHRSKDLNVTGKELASALEREAGAWLKPMLELLYMAVNIRRVENEQEQLFKLAQELYDKGVIG